MSAVVSSARTAAPSNEAWKIVSYSPELTIAPIATLRASRSSPESSRTANPKFSSENWVISVPSRESTGASPRAYMTSPLSKAAMTDGKSSYATTVASGRLAMLSASPLAKMSEVVPDCTPTVIPAALSSDTSLTDADPDPPITPWLLV